MPVMLKMALLLQNDRFEGQSCKTFFMKKHRKNFCCCRKMKRGGSSETRFGQVSRRSEPSSGRKRPFKVCRVRRRARSHPLHDVGDRFDLCRGIPYTFRQACKMFPIYVFGSAVTSVQQTNLSWTTLNHCHARTTSLSLLTSNGTICSKKK